MMKYRNVKIFRAVVVFIAAVFGYGLIWRYSSYEVAFGVFLAFMSHYAEKH